MAGARRSALFTNARTSSVAISLRPCDRTHPLVDLLTERRASPDVDRTVHRLPFRDPLIRATAWPHSNRRCGNGCCEQRQPKQSRSASYRLPGRITALISAPAQRLVHPDANRYWDRARAGGRADHHGPSRSRFFESRSCGTAQKTVSAENVPPTTTHRLWSIAGDKLLSRLAPTLLGDVAVITGIIAATRLTHHSCEHVN